MTVLIFLYWGQAFGQASDAANLWRVTAASLTRPPALATGPAGLAWSPASPLYQSKLSASVHVVHTSDVVGLSGILLGVSHAAGQNVKIGISGGRVDVSDLVRTTSSPTSLGTIPVYEQFLGLGGQYEVGGLIVGGLARLHDARFNLDHDQGVTFDVGGRLRTSSRFVIAAATHFLSIELNGRESTDYYAGAEYVVAPDLKIGRVAAEVLLRYGTTYGASERLEHMLGCGLTVGRQFRLDASVTREAGYQSAGWRPAMAVALRVGRYELGLARSNGLNDLGATYRIGLDATFVR